MKNGAVISVESSWALNIADPDEANVLLRRQAGADTADKVRINYVRITVRLSNVLISPAALL